nr:EAL domain-containing protein [Halalkalibacter alkaliphilus]
MAKYDQLTNLPNRYLINHYLKEAICRCKSNNSKLAVMFLDLDRFKLANDTMGHEAGDQLLIDASNRLKQSVRKRDIIGRQGGDEFIIILEDIEQEEVTQIAKRLIDGFIPAFQLRKKEFFTSPSIGISMYPVDAVEKDELLKLADQAMYLAKELGKNNFQFYSSACNILQRKQLIETALNHAIKNNELSLKYQPQFDLNSSEIVGMEALLRWHHAELGEISPIEFIPIAEETRLIIPIGRWVLQTACQQIHTWQAHGYNPKKVAVNISSLQLQDPELVHFVREIIDHFQIQPSLIELEITESFMQNLAEAQHFLNVLKQLGVSISIDDFGTGYSSLSVINQLPIDRLKIDRTFIKDMLINPKTAILVKTIVEMGHNLHYDLIAEGIEHNEQAKALKELKCPVGQGYLYSPPISAEEIQVLLLQSTERQ